jgi:hypothetical protein
MRDRASGPLIVLLLIASLVGPLATRLPWTHSAEAQTGLELTTQEHSYSFGQHIRFTAELASATPITKVTLLFAEADDLRIFSADLPIPGNRTELQVTYTLDLKEYPLRPYARVEYWWQAESRDGARLETERVSFVYADNRYNWLHVAEDGIAVYYAADEPTLGHTALRVAKEGLARMADLLPAPLTEPISIYIYPTAEELRSALRLAGREWIGGHADPDWSVILVSANGSPTSLLALQSTIPHEMAHLIVYHAAGGKHNQVPVWLHEGLAVRNEPRPDPTFGVALEEALRNGALVPLESLCASFPAEEGAAVQAYAQSASVVRYLQNQFGNQQLKALLGAYGDGADCDGGVQRVLGLSLSQLEAAWLADLRGESKPANAAGIDAEGVLPWVGLIGGGTVLATSLYWLRPRSKTTGPYEETTEIRG